MKAVIFAGGEGRKMFPFTDSRPKAMLRIANKPLVEHVLLTAIEAGLNDFVFIIGYRSEQIRDYFGDGSKWGVKITYRSQEEPVGTSDALNHARDILKDPFVVIHGDVVPDAESLKEIINCNGYAMGVKPMTDTRDFGTVIVEDGIAKKIIEKALVPESNIVNTGIYKLDKAVFDAIDNTDISIRGEYELTESLQTFIESGAKIKCIEMKKWLSITHPWDILTMTEQYVPATLENEGTVEENVHIDGNVSIGKGSVIRAGVYITGTVIIGENCDIGPYCRIRGTTTIGNNCHFGSFVDMKNSIIMDGSKVPHLNYIGDSVIGENCNFGAGSKIANLRFDHKDIGQSGRHKLGALVGDNVNVGINACINAGTIIGNDAIIGPGAVVSQNVMPKSKVF